MRICLIIGVAFVLALSGCDTTKQNFQESFDKSFKESCRKESMKKGASEKFAVKYCDCTLAKFKETRSIDDSAKTCIAQVKSEMNR